MVYNQSLARGIKAFLVIDNNELREFKDNETTPESLVSDGVSDDVAHVTTSVFVEAPDRPYKVVLEVSNNWRSKEAAKLRFILNVDGQDVADVFCSRPDWNKDSKFGPAQSWKYEIEGSESFEKSKKFFKPFLFKTLVRTDESTLRTADYLTKKNKACALATITLRVYRHMASKTKAATKGPNLKASMSKVAEDLLKGKVELMVKSHSTKYGAEKQKKRNGIKIFHDKYLDGADQPLVVYQWRYYSKDALEKLNVIPRSRPSLPPPAFLEEETYEMSAEDRENVRRHQEEIKKLQTGGKRKRVDVKEEERQKHREEVQAAKRAKTSYEALHGPMPKIVIDLCDQDDGGREDSEDLDSTSTSPTPRLLSPSP